MTTRFFLLLERLQKLDTLLRLAQARGHSDPMEVALLRARKRTLRQRLGDVTHANAMRPA